jgi:hypothetical protein
MKIKEILEGYSNSAIDQIASDKVDESANLRLPRNIIIQEISSALNSLSYVASALAPSRPPTYAFIKLLLEAPDHKLPIEGFQKKVMETTEEMTQRAGTGKGLSPEKNYQLYINILKNAWESDQEIDRSEALLLEALRNELDIWTREHLLLEHHPEVRELWDLPGAYVSARNRLLVTGIVMTYGEYYVIADEVAYQIRKSWGIDLEKDAYTRLLRSVKNEQLHKFLNQNSLQLSGTKEERIERIINALIPPSEFLDALQVSELKEFCGQNGIQKSGTKSEVIANIIDHFDRGQDLHEEKEEEPPSKLPEEPEERSLKENELKGLLFNLTSDQLYDVLYECHLKTSGNKEEKVTRLMESPWSEISMLDSLRKKDLSEVCRKMNISNSGIKRELIDRLIEQANIQYSESTQQAVESGQETASQTTRQNVGAKVDKPRGLQDIKADYPELEYDEQIILALIRDTKSLTESDIERASKRHGLGWNLTKARMAEMISKLNHAVKNPLRVRSVQSINIYEWNIEGASEEGRLKKHSAREIIDALRHGVVPDQNLDLLVIGQKKTRDHLKSLLDEAKQNKSPFKFIRGPYGSGKTFLLSWLREQAIKDEFVTSTVIIGPNQSLADLPVFYASVVNGLRTKEKHDSSALADILESWLLTLEKKTAQIEGVDLSDPSSRSRLSELVEQRVETELAQIADVDPGFVPALRAFYRAKMNSDDELANTAINWLSGSESVSAKMLNKIGVRGKLEESQVFPRLRALIEVIKNSRYQGLLLLIDELELIRKFPTSRERGEAFEILRLLVDESGKSGLPGCFLTFTGTDTFFEDDKAGLKSYEALSDRLSLPRSSKGYTNVRQPVISLQGLDKDKLMSVLKQVRYIHGVAFDWNAHEELPDEALERMVQEWTAFGEESVSRKPRPVIREFIHVLDLCEENPDTSYEDIIQLEAPSQNLNSQITDILNQ